MAEEPLQTEARAFLAKAAQNLAAAEADYAAGRYDACANRAYYCCFQAAVAALLVEGIRPAGTGDRWEHEFVQARFAGILIERRKRYVTDLRSTLQENRRVRDQGDYRPMPVTQESASRALRRARAFVAAVEERMPWRQRPSE